MTFVIKARYRLISDTKRKKIEEKRGFCAWKHNIYIYMGMDGGLCSTFSGHSIKEWSQSLNPKKHPLNISFCPPKLIILICPRVSSSPHRTHVEETTIIPCLTRSCVDFIIGPIRPILAFGV